MIQLMQDLSFIESATEMVAKALTDENVKLAEACIISIQNYLNKSHHPRLFSTTWKIYIGTKN